MYNLTLSSMYHTHAKAVAQRQGRPPVSSRISMYTDGPGLASAASSEDGSEKKTKQKGKITAVVDVPQSKYEYNPIDPPIIETPQLRDMGEATPPMEWIGLHRERLPHLTHQVCLSFDQDWGVDMANMRCARLLSWPFWRLREKSRTRIRRFWDRAEEWALLLLENYRGMAFIVLRTRILFKFSHVITWL